MTSDFEAPDGPASSMPPPGSGQVPPSPAPTPPPPATAPPPPPATPPPPPPATPPPPPPATTLPPAPVAGPVPPPPPGAAAPPARPDTSFPPPPPVESDRPGLSAQSTSATNSADLADILARLDDEPVDEPAIDTSTSLPSQPPLSPGVGDELTDPRDLERTTVTPDIVIESDGGLDFDPSFAPFGKRVLELVVDTVILTVSLVPGFLMIWLGGGLAAVGALLMVLGFVAFTVLTARSIAATGQSTGNRVAETRVVDGINGSNIDGGRAALRVIVRHLISTILLLGFVVAFADGQRRTFHDRLAGTVVVGRRREVWTADDHRT